MVKILQHLQYLVGLKTTRENLQDLYKAVEYVERNLKDLYIKRYEKQGYPSLVATFNDTMNPRVLFVGHLDVVPAQDYQFNLRVIDNKAFGRGTLDMKGPISVLIEVFQELMNENLSPDIGLMITTDEEIGGLYGVNFLLNEVGWRSEFAVIPDGGIGFKIINEGKGVLHLKLKLKGKPAHGSTPWLGKNPLDGLLNIYHKIKKNFPQEPCDKSDHWHDTLNLGMISGGDAPNRVPEYAEMLIDIRFIFPKTVEEVFYNIHELARSLEPEVEVEKLSSGDPVYTDLSNSYVQKYMEVQEKIMGKKPELAKEHGATDGRFFSKLGIPVIITYPIGGDIHGNQEWVDLPSLHTLKEIFLAFVKKIFP